MGVRASALRWLSDPHDYAWIVHHHSTRSLNGPIRLVFTACIALYAACSLLLLHSPQGPRGTVAVSITVVVLALQAVTAAFIIFVPAPTTQRAAQLYFVGFAVFGDVGLTVVLLLYSPLVSAVGCALFVITGALCTYFLSSRWLLAHLAWASGVIVFCTWRLARASEIDGFAVAAGGLVLLGAVCGVPIAAHVAWHVLSVDARRSLIDPLTGLRNRRGLEVSVDPVWQSAVHDRSSVAVVIVDIDGFKHVNDTHGHDAGDEVLQRISHRMVELAGPGSVVGRTGGEEFTLVIVGPRREVTMMVGALPLHLHAPDDPIPVTVSVGGAIVGNPLGGAADGEFDAAMRVADAQMYEAKRAGGDRVSVAEV
ncbi:diguanylate cyclase domain-containing protein [Williamsia sp. M5A3_1d]